MQRRKKGKKKEINEGKAKYFKPSSSCRVLF